MIQHLQTPPDRKLYLANCQCGRGRLFNSNGGAEMLSIIIYTTFFEKTTMKFCLLKTQKPRLFIQPGLTFIRRLLFLHFCRQLLNTIFLTDFIIQHFLNFCKGYYSLKVARRKLPRLFFVNFYFTMLGFKFFDALLN